MGVPYLDHPRPVAFAHRGGAANHPENTWAAFEHAVRLGYAYLETDTHATADGKLIAFHDSELDRVTDRTGHVSKLTWKKPTKQPGSSLGRIFEQPGESVVQASEIADNGFSFWYESSLGGFLDFDAGYSRSGSYSLDSFFFGVGINWKAFLHKARQRD